MRHELRQERDRSTWLNRTVPTHPATSRVVFGPPLPTLQRLRHRRGALADASGDTKGSLVCRHPPPAHLWTARARSFGLIPTTRGQRDPPGPPAHKPHPHHPRTPHARGVRPVHGLQHPNAPQPPRPAKPPARCRLPWARHGLIDTHVPTSEHQCQPVAGGSRSVRKLVCRGPPTPSPPPTTATIRGCRSESTLARLKIP